MLDEIKISITYQDTDIGGLVYHARYLDYAEKGRCKILTDLFGKINCQENTEWVVSNLEIKYIKPSTLGDIILVKTTLLDIKKTSIIFKHTFSVEQDKKVEMKVRVANVNKDGRPSRMSEDIINGFKNNLILEN